MTCRLSGSNWWPSDQFSNQQDMTGKVDDFRKRGHNVVPDCVTQTRTSTCQFPTFTYANHEHTIIRPFFRSLSFVLRSCNLTSTTPATEITSISSHFLPRLTICIMLSTVVAKKQVYLTNRWTVAGFSSVSQFKLIYSQLLLVLLNSADPLMLRRNTNSEWNVSGSELWWFSS